MNTVPDYHKAILTCKKHTKVFSNIQIKKLKHKTDTKKRLGLCNNIQLCQFTTGTGKKTSEGVTFVLRKAGSMNVIKTWQHMFATEI